MQLQANKEIFKEKTSNQSFNLQENIITTNSGFFLGGGRGEFSHCNDKCFLGGFSSEIEKREKNYQNFKKKNFKKKKKKNPSPKA
jgi:hypothetical protein